MSIKIIIPKETAADEKRVAASPETVKKLTKPISRVTNLKDEIPMKNQENIEAM